MQLRTFLAKDMKEALAAMRVAMGEDAIIVASETLKDGTVLLRAGIEQDQAPAVPTAQSPHNDSGGQTPGALSRFATVEARYRDGLLARLRGPGSHDTPSATNFDATILREILRAHRTPQSLVDRLVDGAEKCGLTDMMLALATALDKSMRIEPFDATHRRAILVMGQSGAGKTSVAARLAAQHCLADGSAVLAATDLEAAGQVARLEKFADCLNVPVAMIDTPAILADAIQQANQSQTLLIADTAGCDPREPMPRENMAMLSAGDAELVGILSATGDAEEAVEIASAFMKLGATRLIVTGLDLSRRKGTLVAIALCGAAIAHVTSSPYLADGLETLTPMALARMLTMRMTGTVQKAA